MREEEIFKENQYEEYITYLDNRFCFALARRCRLYHYEKLIGINLSVYVDKIDEDSIRTLPLINSLNVEDIEDDDIFLNVAVSAYNQSTKRYVDLGEFKYSLHSKAWTTNELKVKSDFIGDDSSFRVKLEYSLCRTSFRFGGFLGKKKIVDLYGVKDPNVYKLETVITKSNETNKNQNEEDDFDDSLDSLLASRGIK